MSGPKFDSNMWYSLYTAIDGGTQAFVGTAVYAQGGTLGAVYFNTSDDKANNQKWQVFQINSTSWVLRTADGGSNAYLGAEISSSETTEGHTRPCMARGDVADSSALWNFSPWGDGTYYLDNAANGTGYHLNRKNDSIMAMSPNITAPQNGQRWEWATISAINNAKFSTVSLKGVTASTASSSSSSSPGSNSASATSSSTSSASASSSSSPSANNSSSKGLSTGAKAAIGVCVGGIGLMALVLLGLFFMKRRRQQRGPGPRELPHNQVSEAYQGDPVKYEMYNGPKYEMLHEASSPAVEAPSNYQPAELVGDPLSEHPQKPHP